MRGTKYRHLEDKILGKNYNRRLFRETDVNLTSNGRLFHNLLNFKYKINMITYAQELCIMASRKCFI